MNPQTTTTTRRGFLASTAGLIAAGGALGLRPGSAKAQSSRGANPSGSPAGLVGRALREAHYPDVNCTYFNHGSMGTVPRRVTDARCRFLVECETNPWLHIFGHKWDDQVQEAREAIAETFGSTRDELAITRTTTEAMHILAAGLPLGAGDEVLFATANHIGASDCFGHWGKRRGYTTRRFGFPILDAPGYSAPDIVRMYTEQIRDETRLLVLPHLDNLVGINHPVSEIARAAKAAGVEWVAVDGAQAVGCIEVDVKKLGVDFYATSAHKWLQVPKGFGLLHIDKAMIERIEPIYVTWGQSRWSGDARKFEDYGTHDLPSILALGVAAEFQKELGMERTRAYRQTLRAHCMERVDASNKLIWRSPRDPALASPIVAVEVAGRKATDVFAELWPEHGYVFRAFDTDELQTMRLSFNAINETSEIDRMFELIGV